MSRSKNMLLALLLAAILAGILAASVGSSTNNPMFETYVALGDSYSSGEGNPPYYDKTCHTSLKAWPNILARRLNVKHFYNLACSGATIPSMYESYRGKKPQLEALKKLNPTFVTITIGGNDLGFGKMLAKCFIATCKDPTLDIDWQAMASKWRGLFLDIRRIVPSAVILIVTYPRIFPEKSKDITRCGWLGAEDHWRANFATISAGSWEQDIAKTNNLNVAWIFTSLKGHELCSRDSWIFAIRPTCVKDSRCGHPLERAQAAMAIAVEEEIARNPLRYTLIGD